MKRLFFSLCAVGLSCAAFGAGPEVNIVPKPLSVTPGAGTFTVTASTVIGVGKNAELRRSARIFAGEVAPVVGGVMKPPPRATSVWRWTARWRPRPIRSP